jgi:hypothetical protein
MNTLRTTEDITEKIKDILSRHNDCKTVSDKSVAAVLGINKFNFAAMKKRNKIPFKEIILFCDRCGIDPLELIMKSC